MGKVVHTLAQTGTTISKENAKTPIAIVKGNGSDVSNNEVIYARNKRKLITQKITLSLIDVAKKKGHTDRIKEYWNTFNCLGVVISDGERIYGKYCKNRICTVCSGNRKAELINKYLPIVNGWKEPYFVTLTIKSVPAIRLANRMRMMLQALGKVIDKYKTGYKRNKTIRLIGIRSLECNFNPATKTYNPHFHFIVPDKETAEILINEWLHYCKRRCNYRAERWCQDMSKITNVENVLVEVIKYGSKIISRPKVKGIEQFDIPAKIYVSALHNILRAMKGLRLFERFGFNLPKKQKKVSITKELTEYDILKYDIEIFDWVDTESELRLSNYVLLPQIRMLIECNIDNKLE